MPILREECPPTIAGRRTTRGVSKGSFYFHFASKEQILLEMGSATAQAMVDQVEAGLRDDVPVRALIEEVMTSMAQRVVRAPKAAALPLRGVA
jgi:AcrR family transcriptional regulator